MHSCAVDAVTFDAFAFFGCLVSVRDQKCHILLVCCIKAVFLCLIFEFCKSLLELQSLTLAGFN